MGHARFTRIAAGLAACLTAAGAGAAPRHYEANYADARWQVSVGPRACELVHEIPNYGTARFVQYWAQPMRFRVDMHHSLKGYDVVDLHSVPAPWQHQASARNLGQLPVGLGTQPVDINGLTAHRLLTELEQGRFSRLSYRDDEAAQSDVVVTVSSLRLREALPAFQECVSKVLQLEFTPLAEYRVQFDSGSSRLGYLHRRALEDAIRYYKGHRGAIEKIVVGGHTDASGGARANEQISLARARAVRDYLVRRGISAKRIEVRGFGSRWPLDRDNPAPNRRATVWMVSAAE